MSTSNGRTPGVEEKRGRGAPRKGVVGKVEGHEIYFTVIEASIMRTLSDGMRHSREELRQLIDRLATYKNLQDHIKKIRLKINPKGQTIVCELAYRQIWYRHVCLIKNPNYD